MVPILYVTCMVWASDPLWLLMWRSRLLATLEPFEPSPFDLTMFSGSSVDKVQVI